jgi:anti-sigma B factor antagonist
MFEVKIEANDEVQLTGWFDASQVEKAKDVFNQVNKTCQINFEKLDYISSAGLGVLLMTQKRLKENGEQIKLKGMNKHVREIFKYAGFDMIFEIMD